MALLFNRFGGCCCPVVPVPRPFPRISRIIRALIIGILLIGLGVLIIVSPLVAIALLILGLILFLIGRILFPL